MYLAGPPYADEYRRRAASLVRERGWEPVDPMRRDFRGRTEGHERELVEGDLADIDSCDAVLAAFTSPRRGDGRRPGTPTAPASRSSSTPAARGLIRGRSTWRRAFADLEDAVTALVAL